ncbi:MAG: GspE/PulE family protein [Myxococcota bacterium]|nr:GspE/PulE family protein [Myxococcota bacterium]
MSPRGLDNFTELAQFEVDPASVQILSEGFSRRREVVILGKVDRGSITPVQVGTLDPRDRSIADLVASRLNRPVELVQLNRYEIASVIEATWPSQASADKSSAHVLQMDSKDFETTSWAGSATPKPAELVDDLLMQALNRQSSDIHIEAYPGDVDVRLRIDGMLRQLPTQIDPSNLAGVVNRLKVMAQLDITERRMPQDGRLRCEVIDSEGRRCIDFRISILPGLTGEDIVLRVLDTGKGLVSIDELGMPERPSTQLRNLIANPEGLVLVTGPTGSGKTTTLYSSLLELKCSTRKVVTAEDPVEYLIPKLNQKQTSNVVSMADLTRAFLRQDPDVILIGEIRDEDTAEAAAKAATTGHLVLSTLHTNDALGVIPRLRGLGLSDDILADALLGSLNQRLVRLICPECKEPAELSEEHRRIFGGSLDSFELFDGAGCEACFGSGYKGRTGLFEFLLFDQELQDLISGGEPVSVIRASLKGRKHRTLTHDGLHKVREGATSLPEFLRVVPLRTVIAALRP